MPSRRTMPLPFLNPSLSTRSRRSARLRDAVANANTPAKRALKPIYIYPGLIRMSSDRAVTIDTSCPASLYMSTSPPTSPDAPAPQDDTCSICLDPFMSARDIIRRLPCGHYFHSRCILSWICSADRCPLCNEPVLKRDRCVSREPARHQSHQHHHHRLQHQPQQQQPQQRQQEQQPQQQQSPLQLPQPRHGSSGQLPRQHSSATSVARHTQSPGAPDTERVKQLRGAPSALAAATSSSGSPHVPPVVDMPNVNPCTVCHSSCNAPVNSTSQSMPTLPTPSTNTYRETPQAPNPKQDRVYSFVLHDKARFAHLLGGTH